MTALEKFQRLHGRPPRPATALAHSGRRPEEQHGFVNPPVQRGSTVLFPTLDALLAYDQDYTYGRRGTPTSRRLEEAICAMEGGARTFLLPSGYAAITAAMLAFVSAGDHVLVTDSVYHPARRFCDHTLARFGVETTYYDPCIGAGIAALMRPNTRLILTETPGSLTFEMQDIVAIAAVARSRGAWVMTDNTWATPLYFRPLDHGADISIQSGTKYVTGHADTLIGFITVNERALAPMKALYETLGVCVAPEDCFMALRGLRTLAVRLERHWASGLTIARWLAERPDVARVLHPALPGAPGHDLWLRDFTGASGLFSVVLKPYPRTALAAMLDGLTLFGMGYSWGGFESLVVPFEPDAVRSATRFEAGGPCLRLHIGLEDPDDLITDLAAGFERLDAAGGKVAAS
jgi:cystathionine beta-lyase